MSKSANIPIHKVNKQNWFIALQRCKITLRSCYYANNNQTLRQRERHITNHQLLFIEDGLLTVSANEQTFELGSGDMLWIPPGSKRRYHFESASDHIKHLRLRLQILENNKHVSCLSSAQLKPAAWPCLHIFQSVYKCFQQNHQYADQEQRALLQALSASFFAIKAEKNNSPLKQQELYVINQFIRKHAQEDIGPSDLAQLLNLSHDYFSRIFKQSINKTPQQHIKYIRMHLAAEDLMNEQCSNLELAGRYCNGNASLFCRQFKDIHGCTLNQYHHKRQSED